MQTSSSTRRRRVRRCLPRNPFSVHRRRRPPPTNRLRRSRTGFGVSRGTRVPGAGVIFWARSPPGGNRCNRATTRRARIDLQRASSSQSHSPRSRYGWPHLAWEVGPPLPERNMARLAVTAPAADQCSSTPQGSSNCARAVAGVCTRHAVNQRGERRDIRAPPRIIVRTSVEETLRREHGRRAIAHVEHAEHGEQVHLDGSFAHAELARDRLVRQAARKQPHDVRLPRR